MLAISQQWVPHYLYNNFPEVNDASRALPSAEQIDITNTIASKLFPLFGKYYIESIGTILTHQHHKLKKGESVLGERVGDKLQFTPRARTGDECPTSWVAIRTHDEKIQLFRFEGIISTSATNHMYMVAAFVEKNAQSVLQALKPYLQIHSKICLGLYPGLSLGDEKGNRFYLETNDETTSYVKAINDALESENTIPTFVAIRKADTLNDPFLLACLSWCKKSVQGGHVERIHIHK
jgi:hypothetical protein